MKDRKTYAEKLKDPRWQKRRLELFEKAGWTCAECKTKTETLHAHHGYYKRNTDPWDYPDSVMHVLCESCHSDVQGHLEDVHSSIAKLSKFELFLMSEFLSALRSNDEDEVVGGEQVSRILTTLIRVIYDSSAIQTRPDSGPDFEWLIKSAVVSAREDSEQRGYETGIEFQLKQKPQDVVC